jgi:EAL domain-containing protein (putative c-di-GMP-specific phosphodiesterase class I)
MRFRSTQVNLASDLAGAVERGEILAHYQPQIDVATGRIVAVEALARWQHPELGLVPPDVFIPLAEEYELIGEIGDFMIDEGCRCASEWNTAGLDVEVAINVSAAQLLDLHFLDRLESNIRSRELEPGNLIIEITESLPIVEIPAVSERLVALRALGLGIAVDDFGTGHSSFAQWLRLPVTEVKLDQSLVHDPADSRVLMITVVQLAHDQGLRVVAEGVETENDFDLVRELKCDRAQGYFFSRPGPEAEISALLLARA